MTESTVKFNPTNDFDYYPTPSYCVDRLLEALTLPGGVWYEPCAGNGNIIKAVNALRTDVKWKANEIQDKFKPHLEALIDPKDLTIADFLEITPPKVDVIITNPPYSLVGDFIISSLMAADHVAMLLRLSFIASDKRASFLKRNMPDIYIIPNRPNFGPGVSDSTEYAWFVWHKGAKRAESTVRILEDTSSMERKISEKRIFD